MFFASGDGPSLSEAPTKQQFSARFDKFGSDALYKRRALFPRRSSGIHLSLSTVRLDNASCNQCFPQASVQPQQSHYVDLLEFSAFGGLPYPLAPGVGIPSRWAADLRYTWSTPLPHRYPAIHDQVLRSKRVTSTLERVADTTSGEGGEENGELMRKLRARAAAAFLEIRASLSKIVCKIAAYVLFKVFRRLCANIQVVPAQFERLKEAEESGVPLLYLPLHRSHLDYLLITWASWHFGLRLPHIASGDNLNLSGCGWLLRATGAFFIRRRLTEEEDRGTEDEVYRAVLHSYIEEVLGEKQALEFFLEGTRNRFGKPLLPKNGLISNVIEAVNSGSIEDVFLVPVSITYDQVAEGIFLNELMGIPKTREKLWTVLRNIFKGFGVSQRCGIVRMNYGTPLRLTEYIAAISTTTTSARVQPASVTPASAAVASRLRRQPTVANYRELLPWHRAPPEVVDRMVVRGIGVHVVHEATMLGSCHASSVVAAVLLCKYRGGGAKEDVEGDVLWMCNELIRTDCEVVGFNPEETSGRSMLEYGALLLADSIESFSVMEGRVVQEGEELEEAEDEGEKRGVMMVRPLLTHRALVRLAYGRNGILPYVALKAAVGLAFSRYVVGERVKLSALVNEVIDICGWMHFEAIFCKPCESLRERILETLIGKENEKEGEGGGFGSMQSGLLEWNLDEEDGWRGVQEERDGRREERVITEGDWIMMRSAMSRDVILFYSNMLRPFFQSYFLIVARLREYAKEKHNGEGEGRKIRDTAFIRETIKHYLFAHANDTPFAVMLDSINSDSMKNALNVLKERGIVEATPLLALSQKATSSGGLEAIEQELLGILSITRC